MIGTAVHREHDCPHPVDDGDAGDTWTCPACGRVFEAHASVWWAPAEDAHGRPVYRPAHVRGDR